MQGRSQLLQSKLEVYEQLLKKWQPTINLVSPQSLADLNLRHFEDSLQVAWLIPDNVQTVYDLGSGGGFPGIVIALARPDLSVHLIESDQRKCAFLKTVSRETGTIAHIHAERIESLTLSAPDIITARALAPLSKLLQMTEIWWEKNRACQMYFHKGAAFKLEMDEAMKGYRFENEVIASTTNPNAKILHLSMLEKM